MDSSDPDSLAAQTQPVSGLEQFRNSQERLQREAPRLVEERRQAGLEGLVGDLACVIINVEPDRQSQAVQEMRRYSGLEPTGVFEGPRYVTAVLERPGSADVLIRSRRGENPFGPLNDRPKARHLPNTRLETFVFECFDLERYVQIQQSRGQGGSPNAVSGVWCPGFVTPEIIRTDTYGFIQTVPSARVGVSYGFIQWTGPRKVYHFAGRRDIDWRLPPVSAQYRRNIGPLDHVANRLRAQDRDEAILEFIRLTNHNYCFSIYVESLNSITNVTRRSEQDVGLVFTSGIRPYLSAEQAGPTEAFVHNYGPRTHHLALKTEQVEQTFEELKRDGRQFLIELVGGPQEGLHQTFSQPSPHTLIVTEYIHRYGGFAGYFTKSNVTALTAATAKQ